MVKSTVAPGFRDLPAAWLSCQAGRGQGYGVRGCSRSVSWLFGAGLGWRSGGIRYKQGEVLAPLPSRGAKRFA